MKILILDDINANLIMVKRLLQSNGYETITQTDPYIALEILSNDASIDLIITDYMMPEIKGSDFIQLLHSLPCYKNREKLQPPPCILITAWSKEFQAEDATRLGFYTVLKKPFPNQELLDLVATIKIRKINKHKNILFINSDIDKNEILLKEISSLNYRYSFSDTYDEALKNLKNNTTFSAIVLRENDPKNENFQYFLRETSEIKSPLQKKGLPVLLITSVKDKVEQSENSLISFVLSEVIELDSFIKVIQEMHQIK